MPPDEPTVRQLRAIVYRLARAYIEVERGLRPLEHLEPHLTKPEYRRHRRQPARPAGRTGSPFLPDDIVRIHLDRNLPGRVTATLTTREQHEQWRALVVHLARQRDGRWRVAQLQRLDRAHTLPRPVRHHDDHDDGLDQQTERIQAERDLVHAAHRATSARLADLRGAAGEPDRDVTRRLRQQKRTWKTHRDRLDAELQQLRHKRGLRRRLADVDTPVASRDEPTHLDRMQLEAALGPSPSEGWQRRLWDGLADEIHTYRQRWNITEPRNVLGAPTDNVQQQRDRDQLADTLRAGARALGTAPAHDASPHRITEARETPENRRGIAAER